MTTLPSPGPVPTTELVRAPSPAQTVGPFYGYALPFARGGDVAPVGHPDLVTVHGAVLDGAGRPVPDALLEFWQADPSGSVSGTPGSLARDGLTFTGFGRVPTDAAGGWTLRTLLPAALDGATPYLVVAVFARGLLHHLFTRCYLPNPAAAAAPADPLLDSLAPDRRDTLVARLERPGVYRFDVYLQGEKETVFLAYQ
ncbi:protocatechuate 3,4-dioxygenase subunit alpha [Frankia sp. QA3]|uniref:protocatechuate 3,4-dioxygenase subunit alpha n=1 Tax=Frankia sp. QA3 TaxID=710111 RepID=UPI000269BDF3|nr:protocatechuate 3,4-dioxygenase subunit alpha [Frankia sp. QA3]EIV92832.1 protocatechuate 3,4-dioxygenase, alpha subunit [Frankia sp. QA3]